MQVIYKPKVVKYKYDYRDIETSDDIEITIDKKLKDDIILEIKTSDSFPTISLKELKQIIEQIEKHNEDR